MRELYELVHDALQHSSAQGRARAVLFGICVHADVVTWVSRPGVPLLADYAGCSKRTVERDLDELEGAHEIVKLTPGGGRRTASYEIAVGNSTPHSCSTCRGSRATVVRAATTNSTPKQGGEIATLSTDVAYEQNTGTTTPPISPSANGGGITDLFEAMRSRLATMVGSEFIAHTMVDPLELVGRRGDVLEVLAPDHSELRIRRSYGPLLETFARELTGEPLRVRVVTEAQLEQARHPRGRGRVPA